ncbi:MAG: 3-deoxy-manno-octulosonate cytidylyltransferase [Bacillota bacterium]
MESVAVIPARYQSQRFPGKPLAGIAGYPMIQHVYRRVARVKDLDRVIVATDDRRIYETVKGFGGEVVMTSVEHRSGTDRIAEVALGLSADVIVNVQGDEPLIKPGMVSAAIQPFYGDDSLKMSTLKKEIADSSELEDPNVVKVVCDREGNALYFSRSLLPYSRGQRPTYFKHIGLYVYDRQFLLEYSQMQPTPLEKTERLEQLRVLENGYRIKVIETEEDSIGVDTPEDVQKVEQRLKKMEMLEDG